MSNHNLYPHLNQQQTPGSFDDYDSIIDEFSSIGRHDDGSDVSSMQLSELGGASVNIASAQPTPSGSPARSGASGSVRSVRFADRDGNDAGDGGGGAAQFVTASSTLAIPQSTVITMDVPRSANRRNASLLSPYPSSKRLGT